MLLAPAGSKSLEMIGKLYGESFLKLKKISDMQTLVKNLISLLILNMPYDWTILI